MNSHLLLGKVSHRRSRPTRYELEHDVWYFALDLDELDEIPRRVPLVRRNRRGIVSLRDSDYLPAPASDVRAAMRRHLRSERIDVEGGRITLVTNLRVMGYVFNPASFYLCRDASGALAAVVVEVHNTHGERHLYTLRPEPGFSPSSPAFSAGMEKDFYVSPFIGPDGDYRVTVRESATGLAIGINERDGGQPLLATSLTLRRLPLTTGNLVRILVRYPLVSHKTILFIHWHALRLWLRRVPFHRHVPEPSAATPPRPGVTAHGAGR